MTDEDKTTDEDTTIVPAELGVADAPEVAEPEAAPVEEQKAARRSIDWARVVAFGVLPALALLLALAAGAGKYLDSSVRESSRAGIESEQAAKDGTVAILSYTSDKVEQQLNDARNLLSGGFRDSYSGLINDVVIPGAKQKQISAVATVPAASVISAQPNHAVVLVFVNQTVVVGADAPTATASSVRVTLDKSGGKWLISAFEPV